MSKVQALEVVKEEFVGSKGYKLPACSQDFSKDVPENLLKNTIATSHSARIPKKRKVDKSEIPHRKTYSSILYTLKTSFLSTGYPLQDVISPEEPSKKMGTY